ncbi:MAG: four helix bundle protein [Saprospiraceae bacterium]|nr:four helix bundle protein [Saprospiraceae bacterium]
MSYTPIDEIEVYKMAMDIGDEVWGLVIGWDYFLKDTIGKQFCRATDSISANIAEGYGRFHYNENRNFCFYARGSLIESKTWLIKAYKRNLIKEEVYTLLLNKLSVCHLKLNKYIKTIGKPPIQKMTNVPPMTND